MRECVMSMSFATRPVALNFARATTLIYIDVYITYQCTHVYVREMPVTEGHLASVIA